MTTPDGMYLDAELFILTARQPLHPRARVVGTGKPFAGFGITPASLTLARVVETCSACPSQWDAWTVDGHYLYLRYRGGVGTVDAYDAPGPDGWTRVPDGAVARFEDPDDPLNGCISLEEFCARAGLALAPDAVVE